MPAQGGQVVDRQTLARGNAPVFSAYGKSLARHGQGTELVVIVSNRAEAVGRDRVIGIGAYQDTLRFRREVGARARGVAKRASLRERSLFSAL